MELPEKLGRYAVKGILGRGAMGVVCLGFDPLIEREVAIKIIQVPPWFSEEELFEFRERFFREAKAAGRLQHPNIVTVYDIGIDPDTQIPYIVMERIRGRTLKQMIREQGGLPWTFMLNVTLQVAEALAFAHRQGIIHRDVKPSNIMVMDNQHVKITDFGIARLPASDLTRTGQLLGSPSYMAPEQISGQRVTQQSDLFSLGIVLYEGLTGQKPFYGETFSQITFRILNEPPPDLRRIRTDVPEPVCAIVYRLLEKNPQRRFSDADELVRHVREVYRRLIGESAPYPAVTVSAQEPATEASVIALEPTLAEEAIHASETEAVNGSPEHWLNARLSRWPWIRSIVHRIPRDPRVQVLVLIVGIVLISGIFLGGLRIWQRTTRPSTAVPATASQTPSTQTTVQPPSLPPPETAETPQVQCQLRFTVKHKYLSMHLRILEGERTLYEKISYGRIKRLGPIKIVRDTYVVDTLQFPEGVHEITFHMEGEGEIKTKTLEIRCTTNEQYRIYMENIKRQPLHIGTLRLETSTEGAP